MFFLELLIEITRPHSALRPVHRRFIKESGDNGFAKILAEQTIVCIVGIIDKMFYRLLREVVHIGVAIRDALEQHYLPVAIWNFPPQFISGAKVITKIYNLICACIPCHNAHHFS